MKYFLLLVPLLIISFFVIQRNDVELPEVEDSVHQAEIQEEIASDTVPENYLYREYIQVLPVAHPGTHIEGNYISHYDEWTEASYEPSEKNNSLSEEMVEELQNELLVAVNRERQKFTHALVQNNNLEEAAQAFAVHLVVNGFYGHTDKFGRDPFERAKIFGFDAFVTESLVWRNGGVDDAILWWKKSDIHWNNISNPRYTTAGVGVAKEPNGGYIFVLMTGE